LWTVSHTLKYYDVRVTSDKLPRISGDIYRVQKSSLTVVPFAVRITQRISKRATPESRPSFPIGLVWVLRPEDIEVFVMKENI
jgi:hypothetical protein